jgi:hypothetical protein
MSTPNKRSIIPVRVTEQQKAELRALSVRTKVPQQEYLRQALTAMLDKHRAEVQSWTA